MFGKPVREWITVGKTGTRRLINSYCSCPSMRKGLGLDMKNNQGFHSLLVKYFGISMTLFFNLPFQKLWVHSCGVYVDVFYRSLIVPSEQTNTCRLGCETKGGLSTRS